ncbi:MAG: esterase-like activity of phytase family protein [Hyphomicrobiaceae bacterium]|nr:esterase-like activity of phytase family protein [Hyphomicrobiaceae bacterium]
MRHTSDRRWSCPALAAPVVTLAVALVALSSSSAAQKPVTDRIQPIEVVARPIAGFDRQDPDKRRFGRLEWRGGLVLSSPAASFGGWSGLVLDADGRRLLAVSDAGAWLTAEIAYTGVRPTGVGAARTGPLLALGGKRLTRLRDRDPEAVTLAEGSLGGGTALVAFERNHRIGRFRLDETGLSAPLSYLERPRDARGMSSNMGFESVSVLQAGRFKGSPVAFSERLMDARGHHTGWIWTGNGPRAVYLTDSGGFDITDSAPLRDGGLVVLERRFRWTEGVRMRVRQLGPGEISPGSVMKGEVLLEADMGYQIDNMEGVAVHRGPRGETVLTLISDDNFNPLLQRTVLLQFTLHDD